MPRNGSGTMVIPNTFVPNTDISSSAVNADFSDVANEMTNSLALDGQSVMTGALKLANGAAATPALTFGSDTNTGMFRNAADQIGFTQGGVALLLDLIFPVAIVVPFAGSSAPAGFLLCYGQAISRTTYSKLFAAIGTAFGVGDGSTTFNVPDLRGRVVAGLDNMGGVAATRLTSATFTGGATTIGNSGGSQQHVLVTAEMPSHSHTINDPGHSHSIVDPAHSHGVSTPAGGTGPSTTMLGAQNSSGFGTFTDARTTGISIQSAFTGANAAATGGGVGHVNVQPSLLLNYMISTGAV